MKIYIMSDMEGVSGINRKEQVVIGTPPYEAARHLLHSDLNAAIAGAFEGGASEVVVCDGHGDGSTLVISEMDERALYERPNGNDVMPSLDASFAGLFLVGYHAMAGTPAAFFDHTQSDLIRNYLLNGRRSGELAQMAALAGFYDVPVLLVTGDSAACTEAREFFGDLETVEVKRAYGDDCACCIHPNKTRELIREAAARAMKLVGTREPYRLETPLTVRVEYLTSEMADQFIGNHNGQRIDSHSIEHTLNDVRQLVDVMF